jgi:hypothetical protein
MVSTSSEFGTGFRVFGYTSHRSRCVESFLGHPVRVFCTKCVELRLCSDPATEYQWGGSAV